MYFPAGFNKELSIEIGELIITAYDQFASFEDKKTWHLPDKYHLICDLNYTWKFDNVIENRIYNFDITIRKTIHLKNQKSMTIPIGFIAQQNEKIFIIFRGTKTVKEWIHNFSINLKECLLPNYGNIHEGFLLIYDSVRKTILENLQKIDTGNKVFVAGHSLGAALATLVVPDIETTIKKKVTALYTFGSPRVGDDTFVKTFNSSFANKSYRIVNTSDIVTSIPLP
ncbi:lipase family protein, partial [candidate division KSB1 bacterium]|nr:lipase family protein [candidate division KSB1 bacterium]